jgi:toxin ParE1/3/4
VRRCEITRLASQDLNVISDYFLEYNVGAGERFVQGFNQKCMRLAQFPNMGKSYASIRPWLRGLPLQDYIIFYRVTDEALMILRVVHGRQDLSALFEAGDENEGRS